MKIFIFLILSTFIFGCKPRQNPNLLEMTGTLELTEHGVGVPVLGRINTLHVDEGDAVQVGDLIATTDRYTQTVRDYERLVQLLAKGGANKQQVEEAELAMQDQKILSPIEGVVLTKVHDTGEVVDAKSPIVILGDRSTLWVRVYIPEGFINRVKMGQVAKVNFDGLKKDFSGHVTFIAPQAEFTPRNVQTPEERVTQTFAIKVTLDEVQPFLRPGVAADVTLQLDKETP